MKLYSSYDATILNLSNEQFVNHVNNASVIAQESLFNFLYKIKDTFNVMANNINTKGLDKPAIDSTSTMFETLHNLRSLNFVNCRDYMVSKPENFRGRYIEYTEDLIRVSYLVHNETEKILNTLKMAISSFINEYKENNISTIYGVSHFNKIDRLINDNNKIIRKYFPDKNSSTKTYIKDVIRSFNDIEPLYINIEKMDEVLNTKKLKNLSKLTTDCVSLIDNLIEVNTGSNIFEKSSTAKKELITAIHNTARCVEFVSYMYSNIYIFYGTFKNLTDELNRISKLT
jgi:hypothetical protein